MKYQDISFYLNQHNLLFPIENHKIDKFGLSSSLQIHSPVSLSFYKLMPVSNPAFHNANATF
jgi:hypothetical protein